MLNVDKAKLYVLVGLHDVAILNMSVLFSGPFPCKAINKVEWKSAKA